MQDMRTRLRGGHIPVPEKFGVPDVQWKQGVDYSALDREPESFKWWLACLGFLRLVCTSERLSESDEEICRFIIEDWRQQNQLGRSCLSRAWDGHAVGLRSEVFVDVAQRASDDTWLIPLLQEQRDFLASPDNFQGNWNHGIDQARALIVTAKLLDDAAGQAIGLQRLKDALRAIVARDGVSIEQSIHYHYYNYLQIDRSLDILRDQAVSDAQLSDVMARQSMMPAFLAHATKPDGNWFELGDTPQQFAKPIGGSVAEFAASGGTRGPQPDSTVAVYESGYIFGRSGWGVEQSFDRESAYAIRFGAPRVLHGHHDHLSIVYHTLGQDVLRDGGFHGYTDDNQRRFLRSMQAHNCVAPLGPSPRSTLAPTELRESIVHHDWQYYHLAANSLVGVQMQRSILISFDPHAMVVLDTVDAETARAFEQRWLFGSGIRLQKHGDQIEDENATTVQVQQHLAYQTLAIIDPDDPDAPLVSGSAMYETQSCAALRTVSEGQRVAFITSFTFGPRDGRAKVTMTPSQQTDLHGLLMVEQAGCHMQLELAMDGRMRVIRS